MALKSDSNDRASTVQEDEKSSKQKEEKKPKRSVCILRRVSYNQENYIFTMTQQDSQDIALEEEEIPLQEEIQKTPPVAQKISRFGNQGGSQFGKGAIHFNPPNKQRPGRAAGRGR